MFGFLRKAPRPPAPWRRWAADFTKRLEAGGVSIPGRTFADAVDDATRAAGLRPDRIARITVARLDRDCADVILRFQDRKPVTVKVGWPGIGAVVAAHSPQTVPS